MLELLGFASYTHQRPGTPGSGDTLEMPDFVSDIDPGLGEPLLESTVVLDRPHFVSNYKRL